MHCRNHAVPTTAMLLLTLRFLGGGLHLLDAGNLLGVSKASAYRIIRQMSHEIAMLTPEFIKMPTTSDEIQAARVAFYTRGAISRVIGSLDCIRVRIFRPGK